MVFVAPPKLRMAYKSIKDIFYSTGDREARVAHYRIVLFERTAIVTAVVHLRRTGGAQKHSLSRVDEFDTILNRIVDQELRGIRIDRTHLIVQQGTAFFLAIFRLAPQRTSRGKRQR